MSFTRELVRIPSLSLHEGLVAATVREKMSELGYDLTFIDDAGNVVGVVAGGDPRCTVLLESHMDTTGPTASARWSYPPLAAELVADRVVGVGVAECKAALAAQVFAGHLMARRRDGFRVNLVVAAVVAEERGCAVGTRHLVGTTLPRIGCRPKLCVLGEPTGLDVCLGHDGWARIDLDVVTHQAAIADCAAEIVHRELCRHCDSNGRSRSEAVMAAEPPRTERIGDGYRCRVQILRRLFPGEVIDDIVNWLADHVAGELDSLQDASVRVHVHEDQQELYTGRRVKVAVVTPPWTTSLTHPALDCVRDSLLRAGLAWNPRRWSVERLGSGTAGSALSADFGLPAICFGPGDEAAVGAPDESVDVAELVGAVYGLCAIASGLDRSSCFGTDDG